MPNPAIRKLENFSTLSDEEKRALDEAIGRTKEVGAGEDVVRDGACPSDCTLIVKGFACRYKVLEDGRRQIMSFHIPGDICDLQSLLLEKMDHGIGALVPCKVALIPHRTVLELAENYPGIGRALWRDTLIDAAVFREWMVGIGRRTAHERIAHLLCEVLVRFRSVGLAEDHQCDLPLTQAELADSLGLSAVHVNRVLQDLRGEGLIVFQGKFLRISRWERLKQIAGFDPTYLHLRVEGNGKKQGPGLSGRM
jgi:CRP-like cAMP-binding protein